eukprot:CAMPEP_0171503376 /NCGR_PEP_ID=MMETSP0958-20121227/10838_1 /TAXON_ID=87120 /ORGANISM="Aurantiochytrium limacinum, Strain ATCCMYA-1381" /LENGTH=304 /DNA_ID=CAMNT_0012038813 /DNA_START=142 /DNA_END=1058 /DNA_ORIENTATION=+
MTAQTRFAIDRSRVRISNCGKKFKPSLGPKPLLLSIRGQRQRRLRTASLQALAAVRWSLSLSLRAGGGGGEALLRRLVAGKDRENALRLENGNGDAASDGDPCAGIDTAAVAGAKRRRPRAGDLGSRSPRKRLEPRFAGAGGREPSRSSSPPEQWSPAGSGSWPTRLDTKLQQTQRKLQRYSGFESGYLGSAAASAVRKPLPLKSSPSPSPSPLPLPWSLSAAALPSSAAYTAPPELERRLEADLTEALVASSARLQLILEIGVEVEVEVEKLSVAAFAEPKFPWNCQKKSVCRSLHVQTAAVW